MMPDDRVLASGSQFVLNWPGPEGSNITSQKSASVQITPHKSAHRKPYRALQERANSSGIAECEFTGIPHRRRGRKCKLFREGALYGRLECRVAKRIRFARDSLPGQPIHRWFAP